MQQYPEAVRAQIAVAATSHRRHFGKDPAGIWLPECGYYPGLDAFLAEQNIRYFFVDTHGITDATPRPRYGVYAPIYTATGPAAFARDPESSMQVWSAESGYPGDPDYREFYRDVGWDLDYDYVKPYIQPTGQRKNVGIKYYRITGKTAHKEPYDPGRARERAAQPRRELHVQPRAADRAPRLADGRSAADRGLAVRRRAVRSLVVRGADVHRLPRPQGRLRPARLPAGDAGRLPAREP